MKKPIIGISGNFLIDNSGIFPGYERALDNGLTYLLNGGVLIGARSSTHQYIRNRVGEENVFLFGATYEEFNDQKKYGFYDFTLFSKNHRFIQELILDLSNFNDIHLRESFLKILEFTKNTNDAYLCFRDAEEYITKQNYINQIYLDDNHWRQRSFSTIMNAPSFNMSKEYLNIQKLVWEKR